MKSARARVRPLMVRPGARFLCHGDGLCCTDVHALGPITRADLRRLPQLEPERLRWDERLGETVLATSEGRCQQLTRDGCRWHRAFGPDGKPEGCRRFPYGLVATPRGGRVGTSHRCPCRTMGAAPPIDPLAAEHALRGANGRLRADARVEQVRLRGRRAAAFDRYLREEARVMDRVASDMPLERALDAHAFPDLRAMRWIDLASHLEETATDDAQSCALALAGSSMRHLLVDSPIALRARPWAESFERASARSDVSRDPEAMLRDFVLDAIHGLTWASSVSFAVLRAELATRAAIARDLGKRLVRAGTRRDRAMAEALMVVDILGASDAYRYALTHVDERAIGPRG